MQVFVKNLEGRSIAYTVDSSFTSADVKDLIEVRDSRALALKDTGVAYDLAAAHAASGQGWHPELQPGPRLLWEAASR